MQVAAGRACAGEADREREEPVSSVNGAAAGCLHARRRTSSTRRRRRKRRRRTRRTRRTTRRRRRTRKTRKMRKTRKRRTRRTHPRSQLCKPGLDVACWEHAPFEAKACAQMRPALNSGGEIICNSVALGNPVPSALSLSRSLSHHICMDRIDVCRTGMENEAGDGGREMRPHRSRTV